MYLKMFIVPAVVGLVSCSTYEVVEHSHNGGRSWQPGPSHAQLTAGPDAAHTAIARCDQLFTRLGEAHRLCVMRQIDRLGVEPTEPTRPGHLHLPQSAPINILPGNPYPPLTSPPSYAIPVVPQCIGCYK